MPHLSALSLALNRPGAVSLEQVVASLFAAGEQGAWYDPSDRSTLFQDSAGTLPVTEVEQPVGLMLDRRKGLALGSELVTNGDFSNGTTGFTAVNSNVSGSSVISGEFNVVASASGSGGFTQDLTVVQGRTYKVQVTARRIAGSGSVRFQIYDGAAFTTLILQVFDITTTAAAVTYTVYVRTASTTTMRLYLYADTSTTGGFDNVTVKLLDGNHAYQTGSAARPVLRARYNLLTYSEQFDNAAWTKTNITRTTGVADPLGGTGATTLTASGGVGRVYFAVPVTANANYTGSLYIRRRTGTGNINWETFTVGVGDLIPVTSSWTRVTVTGNTPITTAYFGLRIANSGDEIDIFAADFRPGTSAGDYQRIAAATDYATTSTITGQPFRPYLHFVGEDGTGDALQTAALNFTGSDKMTICAGTTRVGASTDAGVIVEFSENWNGNNGSQLFWTGANVNGTGNAFNAASRGTAAASGFQFGFTPTTFAPPTTAVLTAQHDIAGDLTSVRGNGTAGTTGTGDKGSGNWGTYPMHIGRRNDSGATALAYRGYLYGLIVRVAASSAGEVAAVESYMAGKTGVTL